MNAPLQAIPMKYRAPDTGFPKGWYRLAESVDVTADAMLPVSYLDQQLIVYRGPDGTAQVADAYCPHMGAHLASHDGAIHDGKITCPFHKWEFDGTSGRCTNIPYTNIMVPSTVKLTVYPTREIDDMVLMWYHPKGEAPDFEPYSRLKSAADVPWVLYDRRYRISTCPFRDLYENLFDTAHVQQLHNSNFLPEIVSFERTAYGLQTQFAPPKGKEQFPILGLECNFSGVSLMTQRVRGEGFGFLASSSITPIDNERFEGVNRIYVRDMGSKEANAALGEAFAERFKFESDQDHKVLAYKKHLPKPNLCAGDGPIMKWRRYQEEFYA